MEKPNKHESDFETYKHLLESDDISTEIENFNKLTTKINFAKEVFNNENNKKTINENDILFNKLKDVIINLDDSNFEKLKTNYQENKELSILDLFKNDNNRLKSYQKVKI